MDQIRLLPIAEPVCQRDLVIQLHDSAVNQEEAVNFFVLLSRYLQNLKNNKINIAGAV